MATSKYLTKPFSLSRADIDRIFSKVDYNETTGCWLWTGARDRLGYGYVRFMGDVAFCHRLMYAWLVAPLTDGGRKKNDPVLHHVCDNPSCCNPYHLELISHAEHMLKTEGTIGYINSNKTHCPNGHLFPDKTEGLPRRCPICYTEQRKDYYLAHREHIIEKVKKWKLDHRT